MGYVNCLEATLLSSSEQILNYLQLILKNARILGFQFNFQQFTYCTTFQTKGK